MQTRPGICWDADAVRISRESFGVAKNRSSNGHWTRSGAVGASETARIQLAGIEMADSVTIDAHKWFATTMGAGMYITRRPKSLADTFHVSADYMPSNDQSADPYVNSMQWSRRLVGLRLFPPTGHAAVPALVAKIVEQNQQWVSVAYFEQQAVLRVCATNGRSTQATIDTLINSLVAAI